MFDIDLGALIQERGKDCQPYIQKKSPAGEDGASDAEKLWA
jgi:hypothetical protein